MALKDEIRADMVRSAKSGDKLRLSTMRLLVSSIRNREIDLKKPVNDDDVLKIIGTMIRQRKDSVEQFRKGNRSDLADKEEREVDILQAFMPVQLSRDEVVEMVKRVILDTGASGMQDMGKVMKESISRTAGRAEGRLVSDIVKDALGNVK